MFLIDRQLKSLNVTTELSQIAHNVPAKLLFNAG